MPEYAVSADPTALTGTRNVAAEAPTLFADPSRLPHLGTIDVGLRSWWTAIAGFQAAATSDRMRSADRR